MTQRQWTEGRYRRRTRVRGRLPSPLYLLVPKGRLDCGNHEWYLQDRVGVLMANGAAREQRIWRCYHCKVGRKVEHV